MSRTCVSLGALTSLDSDGPASTGAIPRAPQPPDADAARVVRAFLLALAVVTPILLPPFACWEGTDFLCLDSDPWTFRNESGQVVVITPFFVSDTDGTIHPLVVHGFQRGRFRLDVGGARTLALETGDYSLAGVALDFGNGDLRIHVPDAQLPGSITVAPRLFYSAASADVGRATSAVSLGAPLVWSFILWVIAPVLPIALAAALVSRRRSREDRIAAMHDSVASGGAP